MGGNGSKTSRPSSPCKYSAVSWSQLNEAIRFMNRKCSQMRHANDSFICFALSTNSLNSEGWKTRTSVLCFRLNSKTKQMISCKKISFEQFMDIFSSFPTVPGSMTGNDRAAILAEHADENRRCVICRENDNEILLPCLHSFCLRCVIGWQEYRPDFPCPNCRQSTKRPVEDSWEICDVPEQSEVLNYLSLSEDS